MAHQTIKTTTRYRTTKGKLKKGKHRCPVCGKYMGSNH